MKSSTFTQLRLPTALIDDVQIAIPDLHKKLFGRKALRREGGYFVCISKPKPRVLPSRTLVIERTNWTTYANAGQEGDAARGPVYSFVCQVKDGD